ncbi:hypothetical protein LDENG_00237470 [Lucifuga dentata]|nr:hypothetical protein LDENG_00237470 [Lucifuga dentata]
MDEEKIIPSEGDDDDSEHNRLSREPSVVIVKQEDVKNKAPFVTMAAKTKWGVAKEHLMRSPAHDPEADMENADPEVCIKLLQNPTAMSYSRVQQQLEANNQAWMVQFLELRGLDRLMEVLELLSGRGCARFADALLQLTCVACIRAVMNSSTGLHFILDNEGYVRTLSQAVDTSNIMVKKQVFELLAALCLFNQQGHRIVLDALEHYKSLKKKQYRFSVIMNELHATDNVAYMNTLMSMVNMLVLGMEDLKKRDKLRQEFIGLQLLDLLTRLRETEDEDLNIQCDVFENSMTIDKEEMERLYGGIDMSSHQEVFHSLFTKLLSILQALLQVDPGRAEVWLTLETLANRVVLLAQDCGGDVIGAQAISAPGPTRRMKKLNWQKLPSTAVTAHRSMWMLASLETVEVDYCRIEDLFSLPQTQITARAEPKEVSFIDAKKSLDLVIFLSQFKCSHEEFVSLIQKGDRSRFDAAILQKLIKLLPEKHEIENLKAQGTDRDLLSSVDLFYLLLMDVPWCKAKHSAAPFL